MISLKIRFTPEAAVLFSKLHPENKKLIKFALNEIRQSPHSGHDLQEELSGDPISRELLNDIYRQAASHDPHGYLHYSEKQNVSGDIIGLPRAAAVIEGHETHTRTADQMVDLEKIAGLKKEILDSLKDVTIRIPITQAVIYGWYDNEMGSYVNILGDRTVSVAENM